jgi:methionyl-tRNA synthetase
MSKNTITAALPYANGPVHIGHLAGVYIPADIYARYSRLAGMETLFVCGSDEHGVPITLRAKKEGITPQDVVDRYHEIIKKSFSDLGISFDVYSRTSSNTHKETAQDFFKILHDKGAFKEISTEQYYDEEAKQFLADRYITGDCPKCGSEGAYGDQCEKCGSTLSPSELKNVKSALSGNTPILKETKNWYLPLDELQASFLNDYINGRNNWRSTVQGQCKSWLNDGLKERAMTRDLDWGIPVPVEGADGKVLYVWFEAPIGYISATKEARPDDWETWWTGESKLIHFIGKDNIVFHCIIFPAMLHLRGDNYVIPEDVPANEFLNLEGQKISTSRNWAVWLHEYLEEIPNREDELRYVLTSIAPETKDSEFTWKDYQTRINSELVAIYGNFANRVLVLIQKYFEGKIPQKGSEHNPSELSTKYIAPILQKISDYKFRDAQNALMDLARFGNKYLADEEPWKVIKTDPEKAREILGFAYEILVNLGLATEVFMPKIHQKLMLQLGFESQESIKHNFWNKGQWFEVRGENTIGSISLLFSKVEDQTVEAQIEKLQQSIPTPSTVKPIKPMINFEDFTKLDLRIAHVESCKKVEKADKLLQLELNIGSETRTVLSGIAQHFSPEEVEGRDVLYLANLAPRKIRGIESQGMVLLAENEEGKLQFVKPDGVIEPGSTVA